MKAIIKKILKSTGPIGRWLYPKVQKIFQIYAIPAKRKRLQKNGDAVIQKLHATFAQANIPYFLDYGTLLGLFRDQRFIPNDTDIDITIPPVGVASATVLKCLLNNGFTFVHAFRYENNIVEFTVLWEKVTVDVFFCEKAGTQMYTHEVFWEGTRSYLNERMNSIRRYYFPLVENVKTVTVRGYEACFPMDEVSVLEAEYGKGWKVPDPTWSNLTGRKWTLLESFAERVSSKDVLST